jgi:CRP/FNR family cyclic AMP-dependent transcriptional regulator
VRDVELYALAGMAEDLAANLGRFNLFADLGRPQLDAIADTDWERWYSDGERVLRRGMSGSGFYVVLDGEAIVQLGGEERSRLRAGDFFGEVSTLLGTGPTADIVAAGPLRCLEIPGPQLEAFLLDYPRVMFRMLQTEAWRLQEALEWRT